MGRPRSLETVYNRREPLNRVKAMGRESRLDAKSEMGTFCWEFGPCRRRGAKKREIVDVLPAGFFLPNRLQPGELIVDVGCGARERRHGVVGEVSQAREPRHGVAVEMAAESREQVRNHAGQRAENASNGGGLGAGQRRQPALVRDPTEARGSNG
jgi:hypothetical protein